MEVALIQFEYCCPRHKKGRDVLCTSVAGSLYGLCGVDREQVVLVAKYRMTQIGQARRDAQYLAGIVDYWGVKGAGEAWNALEQGRTTMGIIGEPGNEQGDYETTFEGIVTGIIPLPYYAYSRAVYGGQHWRRVAFVAVESWRQGLAADYYEEKMRELERSGQWTLSRSVSGVVEEEQRAGRNALFDFLGQIWRTVIKAQE